MRLPILGTVNLQRRLLTLLGVSSKRNTTFCSFESYLPHLVRWLNPKQALEFGPGSSTKLILKHSNAQIISLETDPAYFEQAKRSIKDARVDLRYSPGPTDFAKLHGTMFDLLFVDGGERVANLIGGRESVEHDGVVVLHDAHREIYLPGVQAYQHGYFVENHSLLLFKSRERFRDVLAAFPPDERCRCKYCGTPERIQYRRRVSELLAP